MEDCVFCQIGRGEIPTHLVYEDELVVAFDDIAPQAPVHTLIIPRAHHERPAVVADEPVFDVFLVGEPSNFRVRPAHHRDQGHVEQVGRIRGGIDENAALKRRLAEPSIDHSPQRLEDRLQH